MDTAQNSIEIQHQVKNNATELNEFLHGMKTWQEEMQVKDKQLLEAARVKKEKDMEKTPSARKLVSPPPKRATKKVDTSKALKGGKDDVNFNEGNPDSNRIKAYDYSAWDKFDVDQACKDMDNTTKQPHKISPNITNQNPHLNSPFDTKETDKNSSEEEVRHRQNLINKQEAVAEKERGNDYFKKGQNSQAIECYTRGIHCDPTNAVLPANRAMALLKDGQMAEAEMDCTLSLSIDPTYVKAYQRRATARVNLKRLPGALKDYCKVLELEPNNKVAKHESDKIKKNIEGPLTTETRKSQRDTPKHDISKDVESVSTKISFEDNIKSAFSANKPKDVHKNIKSIVKQNATQSVLKPGQVLPIKKKPHLRSKKQLRRIPIEEVGYMQEIPSNVAQNTKSTDQQRDFIIRKSSESMKMDQSATKNGVGTTKYELQDSSSSDHTRNMSSHIDDSSKSQVSPKPKGHKIKIEEIASSEENHSINVAIDQEDITDNLTQCSISKSKGFIKKVEEDLNMPPQPISAITKCSNNISKISRPASSMSFYSTWNSLKDSSNLEKLEYLNIMRPKDYPIIFKHSLEPKVFEQILQVLSLCIQEEEDDVEVVGNHLYGLSKVPRVSAMVMFLGPADTASFHKLVNSVLEKSQKLKNAQKESIKRLLI